ncbi:MAG: phytanoyl-CoA dioxygenase family protein [Exilibacterium sp.]
MIENGSRLLTTGQLESYEQQGFLQSLPVLSAVEVDRFRTEVENTRRALGNRVTRFDAAHHFFRWAWDLSTHPRLLDYMEQLLGPDILLKSTRLFYKHANSTAFVGWHQDGFTEALRDTHVPTVWLGLTPSTKTNGCLRILPSSHRLGLLPHPRRPDPDNLTTAGTTAEIKNNRGCDIVMRAGEMSVHHPLTVHSSDANRSTEPRIGFSASYSTPALRKSRTPIAWVRGSGPVAGFEILTKPVPQDPCMAVAEYRRHHSHQIHVATPTPEWHREGEVTDR